MSMMQTRLFASSLPNQVSDRRRVEPPGPRIPALRTDAVVVLSILPQHNRRSRHMKSTRLCGFPGWGTRGSRCENQRYLLDTKPKTWQVRGPMISGRWTAPHQLRPAKQRSDQVNQYDQMQVSSGPSSGPRLRHVRACRIITACKCSTCDACVYIQEEHCTHVLQQDQPSVLDDLSLLLSVGCH